MVRFLSVFLLCSTMLFAADRVLASGEISVSAEVDKAFVTIGEPFKYRIVVQHDAAIHLSGTVGSNHLSDFRIKESERINPHQEGDLTVLGESFVLVAYRLGEYVINGVPISYEDQEGNQKVIETNKLYVTVKSIDPTRTLKSDIRGLKFVKDLLYASRWIWATLGLFLCLFVIGGWLFLKRRSVLGLAIQDRQLSPVEWAYQELHALFDSKLLFEGKVKEYYDRLSFILRTYLDRQFSVPALEFTTREIRRYLKEKEWDSAVRNDLVHVLEDCDMVKFAKFVPAAPSIPQLNKLAESLIKRTEPPKPSEAEEAEVKKI